MDADEFSEDEFFRAIARSGARVLLIGRRALVALGLPVMTADYDLWTPADDIERLNAAVAHLGLEPNRSAAEARARGRYVLENGEHVDVLVARSMRTADGQEVAFDALWSRRSTLELRGDVALEIPCIADLILTKRVAMRPKDLVDIELLEELAKRGRS